MNWIIGLSCFVVLWYVAGYVVKFLEIIDAKHKEAVKKNDTEKAPD